MDIPNYRITFETKDIDYKKNFAKCREYIDIIEEIMALAKHHEIEHIWYFFEPYVEITWIDYEPNHVLLDDVKQLLEKKHAGHTISVMTPKDGFFAEWFGQSNEEHVLGYRRYAAIAELSRLLLRNQRIIEQGEGWEQHFIRCCHTLANQIGLTHKDEGIAMIKRGIFCLVSYYGGYEKACEMFKDLKFQDLFSLIGDKI